MTNLYLFIGSPKIFSDILLNTILISVRNFYFPSPVRLICNLHTSHFLACPVSVNIVELLLIVMCSNINSCRTPNIITLLAVHNHMSIRSRAGTLNLRGSLRRLFSLTSSETSNTLVKSEPPPSPNNRILIVGLGNYPAPRSRHSVGKCL